MPRAVHVSTAHGSGDVGTKARDMCGLSRRHHRFLKGATGPSAKAEEYLRASTSSEVDTKTSRFSFGVWLTGIQPTCCEAHEEQTTPATSRLPGTRCLGGRHCHGPGEDQKRRDVADPDVIEGGSALSRPPQLLSSLRERFHENSLALAPVSWLECAIHLDAGLSTGFHRTSASSYDEACAGNSDG